MKILIAYATKSGASRVCAEMLSNCFPESDVADLSKGFPGLKSYDAVIIGSGIRMGRPYKPLLRFLKENSALLKERPLALYLCNGEPDTFETSVRRAFPPELLSHALCVKSFGGKHPFSRSQTTEWMDLDAIEELSRKVKAAETDLNS